jgi:predicted ATPase/DNA-binding XRE family transcriptional regulator
MEQRSFGYWLRLKRKALDLTREELAERIGYSAATVRKIEDEERYPSAQVVERLAELLKIPQNERTDFLRFARGDLQALPGQIQEDIPWHTPAKSTRSNLPAPVTSLIGRQQEIADVREYLAKNDIRLVTLIGPPGIGKTRLGIEVARASLSDFSDGVFFVALAALDHPDLIASTLAQALGYVSAGNISASDQIKEGIGDKQMLLVLDNCEHLIEDVSSLASELLSTCSYLKILATSREYLRIIGEWLYPVPALDVPALNVTHESSSMDITISDFPALTLFAERARAVRPDFVLNSQNIQAVSMICAHLDGLPLAIELIAARIRLMSPQALLERMTDQSVLTTVGMRAPSERQKTLRNAIEWSYNLLSAKEQKLFAYLSVFAGGFTLEAAEAIFSRMVTDKPISDLIISLLDKSLLQHTNDALGRPRFTMLVTIQQFARDRLREMDEETKACNWHLAYFSEVARQARSHLRSADQVEWLDRLDTEHDNIRAALSWAHASDSIAMGLSLATDLEMFWIYRAYLQESCLALENLLANPIPVDHIRVFVRAHTVAGHLQNFLGNRALSRAHAQEAERLCLQLEPLNKADLADARNVLTYTDLDALNDPVRTRQQHEENLKLFQEAGDQWNIAHTLYNIGETLRQTGDFMRARQAFEQSLAIFRKCGDNIRVVHQKGELAAIAFEEGKYAEARKRYEEVLSFYRQARFNLLMSVPLYMLGMIAIREGDYARAKAWFSECLLFEQQKGMSFFLSQCLIKFAGIADAETRFERAAQIVGAAEMQVEARQFPLDNTDQAELKRLTTILRGELGDAEFEALRVKGRAMTMEQAIAYALDDQDS